MCHIFGAIYQASETETTPALTNPTVVMSLSILLEDDVII